MSAATKGPWTFARSETYRAEIKGSGIGFDRATLAELAREGGP